MIAGTQSQWERATCPTPFEALRGTVNRGFYARKASRTYERHATASCTPDALGARPGLANVSLRPPNVKRLGVHWDCHFGDRNILGCARRAGLQGSDQGASKHPCPQMLRQAWIQHATEARAAPVCTLHMRRYPCPRPRRDSAGPGAPGELRAIIAAIQKGRLQQPGFDPGTFSVLD